MIEAAVAETVCMHCARAPLRSGCADAGPDIAR